MPSMHARRYATNAVMTTLTAACAFVAVAVLALILGYIAYRGIGAISFQFLIETPKPVGEGGGIGNAILGTLILLGMACVVGMPFGIATGIYLAEYGAGRFASLVRFLTDTLTGIPSILVGVFVYTIIVVPLKQFSALAGGVALAVIMIPIVARTTEEMLRLVPASLREGALALGAPQWRVTTGVVLPAAASGIVTGAMLAVARVSGETAPLLFTAFGSRFFNVYLDQPMASLTVQIYNYAISPYDEWHAQAWAATLILMTLILVINITVRFFTRRKI
ncbi:MAG TPA: phosphate ABC transporter permease PstA [Pyrinomonadaceae bacterium]|jgi:phosphate transport system permease protein|nr:phosphate ABC transporter permease PstA [Pyrinomonadaceae bacterium]